MKRYFITGLSLIVATIVLSTGCTKYFNPEPEFEEYEQEPDNSIKRKVLFISIDGLVGEEMRKEVPTHISALMKNAKYSYVAVTDANTSDPATWATMLTGYTSARHHIEDENYLPAANPDDPHDEVNFTPSIIYRLEDQQPSLRTTVIVQDPGVANVLLMDADDNVLVDDDTKVKEEAVKVLNRIAPDVMVLQFQDVLTAGKTTGFSMTNADYAAALTRVDGHIGEVMDALRKRPTAPYEDWLVIITSNHGGVGTNYGGSTYEERNIFSLYYQKDIVGEELVPETIESPHFYGYDGTENGPAEGVRARNLTAVAGEENYNFAKTGQLTIEAKIKVNKNAAGNWSYFYPPFLSKTESRYGSTAGWSLFRTGNNVAFWCADGAKSMEVVSGGVSINDEWAHLTATVTSDGGNITTKIYINGALGTEKTDALNINNILSTSPLTFGFQGTVFSGGFIDMHIADVHIWNTVLTEDEIRINSRRMGVSENHAKLANLVGYWPMDDKDGILRNKVEGMPNIPLQGMYAYKIVGNNLPFIDDSSILVQNIDVASHMLYWLGVNPHESWALDGKVFLSKFELEFLK